MTRRTHLLLLLLVLLASAAAVAAERSERGPDSRLLRRVPHTQLEGSVERYLESLREKSAVALQAASPWAKRPLVALNANLSLKGHQEALARLYQLSWKTSDDAPPGYLLYESAADRQARAGAKARVQRIARQKMLNRWEQVRQVVSGQPGWSERFRESDPAMAKALQGPRSRAIGRLVSALPEPVLRQFLTTGSYQTQVSALPPTLQRDADMAWARNSIRPSKPPIEEGTFSLRIGGTFDRPTVWASLTSGGHGFHSNLLYAEAWGRHEPADRRREARGNPTKPPRDPRFLKRVTLRDPERKKPTESGNRPPGAKPLAELLYDLSRQVELPLLAECEYLPQEKDWLARQWWLAAEIEDRPLHEALDLLGADFEYEWKFEGGVLLLRPRLWFLDPEDRKYLSPV
jgi:hypothetical protein